MYKLIAATLAGLFVVFQIYGSEDRRPEKVARASADKLNFSISDLLPDEDARAVSSAPSGISETEAVELALAAGVELRANRASGPLRGAIQGSNSTSVEPPSARDMWYVVGSQVNLRAGPGTGNAVVATVSFGREAELLDSANGWHQIRTADGATSGWIFGKFLSEQRPG